jgi:hypothetical protein
VIRIQLGERRRALLRDTLGTGDPDRRVHEVLGVPDASIIMAVRHAESMIVWLRRCHAHYGLGYPTTLIELHTKMAEHLLDLSGHPALWGHGMLGQPRSLPISCWRLDGSRYPDQLYTLTPSGTEGYLVPTKERVGSSIVTAWAFTPMRHEGPRAAQSMFRPSFATAGGVHVDPATQEAAAAKVRAAILEGAEAPLGQDDPDLPPPARAGGEDAGQLLG